MTTNYPPNHAREDRSDVLLRAIEAIQFGSIVGLREGTLAATHIPLIARSTDNGVVLEGHVARANPLASLAGGEGVLALFQGPHGYIRPGWLETKRKTGKGVPTWAYMMIEAHGTLSLERDPVWLLDHLARMTARNEAGKPDPWSANDAPPGFIDTLVGGICGITVRVNRLQGIWKLQSHHPEANRRGMLVGLRRSARRLDHDLADAMEAQWGQRRLSSDDPF